MATYVPNASDTTEPTSSQSVESAALEFRTLKLRVNTLETAVNTEDAKDLRVPEASIAPIPSVSTRAGKVLGFDAGGDPVAIIVTGDEDPGLRVDLSASSGASLVGYIPAGVGAVPADVQKELRDTVNAKRFYTDDIGVAINLAVQSLPNGGTIEWRDEGVTRATSVQILINKPGITLDLHGVTILSNYQAVMGSGFSDNASAIWVTASYCTIRGNGNSTIKLGAGIKSNCVSFIMCHDWAVRDITLDGNKDNTSGQADDTWQVGVYIRSTSGGGQTSGANGAIDNCAIINQIHYGVSTWGDTSGQCKITKCNFSGNGKAGAPNSVGTAVMLNNNATGTQVIGNQIVYNKGDGIFVNNAGGTTSIHSTAVSNNIISYNVNGIVFYENSGFFSTVDTGSFGSVISNNTLRGHSGRGIMLATTSNVGVIADTSILGNTVSGCGVDGIFILGNNHPTSNTRNTSVTGNIVTGCGDFGIRVSDYAKGTLVSGNVSLDNVGGNLFVSTLSVNTLKQNNITSATPQSGVWTPTDGSGAGLTFTSSGEYTRIGDVVVAACDIAYPTTASGLAAVISGLPFISKTSSGNMYAAPLTLTTAPIVFSGTVVQSSSNITLYKAGAAAVLNSELSGNIVRLTATYIAA